MSQLRDLVSLFGVLSMGAAPTTSRAADKIGTGERLRIVYTSEKEIGGRLLGPTVSMRGALRDANGETISLVTPRGDQAIPVASITRVERWAGTDRHTLTGALIGAGVFTVLGSALASSIYDGTPVDEIAEGAVPFVVGSAVVGLIVGAMAGYSTETDRWEPASVADFQVGISPRDGSTTISAVVRY